MRGLVLIAMMGLLMMLAPAGAQTPGKWIKRAPFPEPSEELAGAVIGNRLHLASGDIQSAGITGLRVVTDSHDVLELGDR